MPELQSTEEEADTRLILHALHSVQHDGVKLVIFKLMLSACVVSICCVGFVSLDVGCDELNDCAWNVCL